MLESNERRNHNCCRKRIWDSCCCRWRTYEYCWTCREIEDNCCNENRNGSGNNFEADNFQENNEFFGAPVGFGGFCGFF